MFNVNYQLRPGFNVSLDGDNEKDLFEKLARLHEVFGQNECGDKDCKSKNLAFVVRVVDDNKYYELLCKKCGRSLQFGANRKGHTLFPKRYETDDKGNAITKGDGSKNWFPNNGWMKFDAKQGKRV